MRENLLIPRVRESTQLQFAVIYQQSRSPIHAFWEMETQHSLYLSVCFQTWIKGMKPVNNLYSSLRIGWSLGNANKLVKILSFQPLLTVVPSLSPPSPLHLSFSPQQNYKHFYTATIVETLNAWYMQAISSLMKTIQITKLYQTKVLKAAIC